jgi:anti-sigma B factor antagonist
MRELSRVVGSTGEETSVAVSISAGAPTDGVVTIAVGGEVDAVAAEPMRETIKTSVNTDGVRELVLDLAKATFLDSTGIGVLVEGRRMADERATRYRVVHPRGVVRSVLEITGVLDYLCEP